MGPGIKLRRSPVWRRVGLTAAGGLFSLGVAEVTLRALGLPKPLDDFAFLQVDPASWQGFESDPDLFWRLRPQERFDRPNRLGLRGWWPSGRTAATLRIACVGDSSTFGVGHRLEDSYGLLLEQRLQQQLPDRNVETVLAALPGYSSYQDRVLYLRDVAPLRPEVTVLYVGAYNDYNPGVGATDAQRAAADRAFADAWYGGLRLALLTKRVWDGLTMRQVRAKAREAHESGQEPAVPRVPLLEFQDHVETIVAAAREWQGLVIVVLPPLPASTRQRWPIAQRYHDALAEIAVRHRLPVVAAAELFAAAEAEIPAELRTLPTGYSACYFDWVHPSPLGHQVLAAALADIVVAQTPARSAAASATVRLDKVPATLAPGTQQLLVEGHGFAAGGIERVWFGDLWVRDFTVVDDRRVRLSLPPLLSAGSRRVVLRTAYGAISSQLVEVAPRRVRAQVHSRGVISAELALDDLPPAKVLLWLTETPAAMPRQTPYGEFHLLGHLPDGPTVPVVWPLLRQELPHALEAELPAGGAWQHVLTLDKVPTRAVYVQAAVVDPREPHYGCLTTLATVEVIR